MQSSEYSDVYKKFDKDGDGDITPDELISVWKKNFYYSAKPSDFQILVKLGEVPMDLALYFNDMSSSASTEFAGVVNFLTILTNYCKFSTNLGLRAELIRQLWPSTPATRYFDDYLNLGSMKNPAKVEQEVLQELEEFSEGNETINKEQLQDWLFKIHPEFDDDLLESKIL